MSRHSATAERLLRLRHRRRRYGGLRARESPHADDSRNRVLLLEAGPEDRSPWIHLPIGYGKTMFHPVYNWGFYTDPDPGMDGRRIYWPRGRCLGGSSSINGLIYVRGQREDYDALGGGRQPRLGLERRAAVLRAQRVELARRDRGARCGRPAGLLRHRQHGMS